MMWVFIAVVFLLGLVMFLGGLLSKFPTEVPKTEEKYDPLGILGGKGEKGKKSS